MEQDGCLRHTLRTNPGTLPEKEPTQTSAKKVDDEASVTPQKRTRGKSSPKKQLAR